LDGEIWERINRNPKDTMTTEHKKYLGLPWHRWSGAIPYTTAKAILEAETQKIDGESRKGEKTMSKPNKYQPKTNNPSAEIDERDVNSFAAVLAQQPASDFRDQFTGRKMTFHAVLRAIAEINLRRAEVNMRAIDAFDSVRKEFTSVEELLQASQKLRLMDLAEQSRTAPENFRRLVPVERVGDESAPAQSND
jgi:hypothetical protein